MFLLPWLTEKRDVTDTLAVVQWSMTATERTLYFSALAPNL